MDDKCYLDPRHVVHCNYGSESDTPLFPSQVNVSLVSNDKFNDVCSWLQVVQPSLRSSISSSMGVLPQSLVPQDPRLFEPNSFVTLHNLVYTLGQPNFLGARLPVPTQHRSL